MSYFKGYKYEITNYGSQFKFTVYHNGGITAEGYAPTQNSALTKMKRVVNMYVG